MNIFKAMKPERVYTTAKMIPWVSLKSEGITVALLDFDNTLGPDHATAPIGTGPFKFDSYKVQDSFVCCDLDDFSKKISKAV